MQARSSTGLTDVLCCWNYETCGYCWHVIIWYCKHSTGTTRMQLLSWRHVWDAVTNVLLGQVLPRQRASQWQWMTGLNVWGWRITRICLPLIDLCRSALDDIAVSHVSMVIGSDWRSDTLISSIVSYRIVCYFWYIQIGGERSFRRRRLSYDCSEKTGVIINCTGQHRTGPVPDCSRRLSSCFWSAEVFSSGVEAFALKSWCLGFNWISRKHRIRPCRLWSRLITSFDGNPFLFSVADN